MASINDQAGIFVGDTLELFNLMEILVARDGDVAGAQAELTPVMQLIIARKQSAPEGFDPSAGSDIPRG